MTAETSATRGQRLVDGLVALLDLEKIDEDIYRGLSPKVSLQRVFGGQVAGQALVAAGRTVDPIRTVNSLHAYFIRPGDPEVPIVYSVDRARDGRSFSIRRVTATQHGKVIFVLSASFQLPQAGIDHQSQMPDVPPPESLPPASELQEEAPAAVRSIPWPLDIRYVDPPSWQQRLIGPRESARQRLWMRTSGRLPDDPLLHVCALTYASDLTLLDVVLVRHGLSVVDRRLSLASLDHAMWFHRPFRSDEWFLYSQETPSASGGRGLAMGRIFKQDGTHVVTVVQEGMIRVHDADFHDVG